MIAPLTQLSAAGIVIRVPLPAEAQVPVAIAGGVILAFCYLVVARGMIARDPKTGWLWLIGMTLLPLFAAAVAVTYGEMDAQLALERAPGSLLLGAVSLLCLRGAHWYRTATWAARLAALAIVVKLVLRPLIVSGSIGAGGQLVIIPAGMTHPASLILGAQLVFFAAIGLWPRRRPADVVPRAVATPLRADADTDSRAA